MHFLQLNMPLSREATLFQLGTPHIHGKPQIKKSIFSPKNHPHVWSFSTPEHQESIVLRSTDKQVSLALHFLPL